ARMRKAAANQILEILTDDEAKDVTALDFDVLMKRFSNLEGQNYTPGSLGTYRSRLKSSLDDFASYLENPLAFRSGTQSRERKPRMKDDAKGSAGEKQLQHNESAGRYSP